MQLHHRLGPTTIDHSRRFPALFSHLFGISLPVSTFTVSTLNKSIKCNISFDNLVWLWTPYDIKLVIYGSGTSPYRKIGKRRNGLSVRFECKYLYCYEHSEYFVIVCIFCDQRQLVIIENKLYTCHIHERRQSSKTMKNYSSAGSHFENSRHSVILCYYDYRKLKSNSNSKCFCS